MRRPHAGEALGFGFDHRAEIVAAMGALLVQLEADGGQIVVADRLRQHHARGLVTKRTLDGVAAQQRIVAQHDGLRNTWQVQSGLADHAVSIAGALRHWHG